MRVIDPGHEYLLNSLDGGEPVLLTFVKREGEGYPGNIGHHPGTNLQEVLRALIERVKYLNNQIPDARNWHVLLYLREALFELEQRAAERHGRVLSYFKLDEIEFQLTCSKCGHIGCHGECH